MSDDDFDRVFGARPTLTPSFADRVGRASSVPSPIDPRHSMEVDAARHALGADGYKPYGYLPTNAIGDTCDVRRWMEGTDVAEGVEFSFRLLLQVAYVGEEQLRLFLPDTIILVEGANLNELRQKLARRQATFIQQYSPRIWPRPSGVGADFAQCEDRLFRFSISIHYSYGGMCGPIRGDAQGYATRQVAEDAALAEALERLPVGWPGEPASVHHELRELREMLEARDRQPLLL